MDPYADYPIDDDIYMVQDRVRVYRNNAPYVKRLVFKPREEGDLMKQQPAGRRDIEKAIQLARAIYPGRRMQVLIGQKDALYFRNGPFFGPMDAPVWYYPQNQLSGTEEHWLEERDQYDLIAEGGFDVLNINILLQ